MLPKRFGNFRRSGFAAKVGACARRHKHFRAGRQTDAAEETPLQRDPFEPQPPAIRAATDAAIERAVEILDAGGLVALPTETVYGLAGDADNALAVARIFAAKGRPRFNPLICHVTGRETAGTLVHIPEAMDRLIEAFWPGPLTLVLPKRARAPVADLVSAGLDRLAVRAPAHHVARQVLHRLGRPVAAPSANRSGRVSPTLARHVADDLGGEVELILDGGACGIGLESTIVGMDTDGLRILRPGSVTAEDIFEATGAEISTEPEDGVTDGRVTAPGQLSSHYAPRAPVRLEAVEKRPGEILLGFGRVAGDIPLSRTGDLVEAAAKLFAALREADAKADTAIAVAPIPERGLGRAINDRLRRAAAPRE